MPKSRTHKAGKGSKKPRRGKTPPKWYFLRWPWNLIVALATIASVFAFYPRVSVSPSSSIYPSDPLETAFEVSNNGLFSIHKVKIICWINDLTIPKEGPQYPMKWGPGIGPTGRGLDADILEPNHSVTPPCYDYVKLHGFKDISADMTIQVLYQPFGWLDWPRLHDEFRFVTVPNNEGGYLWIPRPNKSVPHGARVIFGNDQNPN